MGGRINANEVENADASGFLLTHRENMAATHITTELSTMLNIG